MTRTAETPDVAPTSVLVLTSAPAPHDNHLALARMGVTYAFITVIKTSLDVPPVDDGAEAAAAAATEEGDERDTDRANNNAEPEGRILPRRPRPRRLPGQVDRRYLQSHDPVERLLGAAHADYVTAVSLARDGVLRASHVAAWASEVWIGGVEIGGRPDVAAVANASLYSLASYLRPDWPFGSSPGGLSAPGYNGYVHSALGACSTCCTNARACHNGGIFPPRTNIAAISFGIMIRSRR